MKKTMFSIIFVLIVAGCGTWVLDLGILETFTVGGNPNFSAVNDQTGKLYVSDATAGTVTMYDATTAEKLAVTVTGSQAQTVAVDSMRNLVYVVNRAANTLTILDGATNTKLADIPVGTSPQGLDLDLANNRAFTSNVGSNDVTVVDTNSRTVIKSITVGVEPWAVSYDAKNGWIYVANTGEGTVSRIDPNTGATLANVNVGGRPWNIKASQRQGKTFVTNETLGTLSVIQRDQVILENPIGDTPFGLVLHDELLFAYVAMKGSKVVKAVDMVNGGVLSEIPVGTSPTSIAIDLLNRTDGVSGKLYISNQGDGTISVAGIYFHRYI